MGAIMGAGINLTSGYFLFQLTVDDADDFCIRSFPGEVVEQIAACREIAQQIEHKMQKIRNNLSQQQVLKLDVIGSTPILPANHLSNFGHRR